MNVLRDIPNREGFEFWGIPVDYPAVPPMRCVVALDSVGMHTVLRKRDAEPVWFKLIGWEPIDAPPTPGSEK